MKENNPVLRKNLEALHEKNPELGLMIERHRPSGEFHRRDTPGSALTLLHIPATGNARYIHSPEDPIQEAVDLLESYEFRGEDITVLSGFGLGYLPLAIKRKMHPEHLLIIAESSLDILYEAFSITDLSDLLQDSSVYLLKTDQKEFLWTTLDQYNLKNIAGKVQKLAYPPCVNLDPESFRDMETGVERFIRLINNNYFAMHANEESSTANMMKNLSFLHNSAPVNCMKGIAANRPVIIVAAGPSLDKNIHSLKDFKRKAIIIAVDTALKPLIRAGMLPNMLVSVDPTEGNLNKFKKIPKDILDQIVPVFSLSVYHEIPELFSKNRFFFNEPGDLNSWFLEMEPLVVQFPKGNSVSHYAFYLARFMSPSHIIFVGLDLAFPVMQAHSKYSDTWNLSPNMKFIMTPDIHGGMVRTIPAFRDAITVLEAQIANTQITCIDATEGGAMIQGTRIMPLKHAFDRDANNVDIASLPFSALWSQSKKIEFRTLIDKLDWFIGTARDVEKLSKNGIETVSSLLNDIDMHGLNDPRVQEGISRVNSIMDLIEGHSLYMALIKQRLDSVYISQYRTKFMIEREVEQKKKVIMQIASSKEYFSRINEATSILIRSREKAEIKRDTLLQSCKSCGD